MVTRIRGKSGGRRRHLYITEWREFRGLGTLEQLGNRFDPPVDRATIYRWENEQHRLNPDKIAALAKALDCEPEELWRPPPPRPSLDAMIRDAPEELQNTAADIVRRLVGRR